MYNHDLDQCEISYPPLEYSTANITTISSCCANGLFFFHFLVLSSTTWCSHVKYQLVIVSFKSKWQAIGFFLWKVLYNAWLLIGFQLRTLLRGDLPCCVFEIKGLVRTFGWKLFVPRYLKGMCEEGPLTHHNTVCRIVLSRWKSVIGV